MASCSVSDDDAAMSRPGAPEWEAGYPVVAAGAVTADLNVRTSHSAKVYYLVADKPLDYSASQVKTYALKPANAAIKAYGVLEAGSSGESRKTIPRLVQNKRYYAYFVAQNTSDTIYQNTVKTHQFVTASRQDTLEFRSAVESRTVKYLIYRPEEAIKYPDKKYPVCYFLGGNGEVASQDKPVNLIRNGSLPEYIYKGNDVPMMVMSIQHDRQNWNVSLIDEAITHGNSTLPVDPARVYLTGMSGGGFGCWNYAVAYPEKLAAIVPISGGGNTAKACTLKNVAVWGFHNQIDNVVAPANTINMINALNKCPSNKEVSILLFPDSGHDCWRRVYDQNHPNWTKSPDVPRVDIYKWLLSKSR
jgi:predicted peptidase